MKQRPKDEPSPASPANDAAPAESTPAAETPSGSVESALLAENKQLKELVNHLQQVNGRMVARLNAIIFAATAS